LWPIGSVTLHLETSKNLNVAIDEVDPLDLGSSVGHPAKGAPWARRHVHNGLFALVANPEVAAVAEDVFNASFKADHAVEVPDVLNRALLVDNLNFRDRLRGLLGRSMQGCRPVDNQLAQPASHVELSCS